jgi:hypothetical protein
MGRGGDGWQCAQPSWVGSSGIEVWHGGGDRWQCAAKLGGQW